MNASRTTVSVSVKLTFKIIQASSTSRTLGKTRNLVKRFRTVAQPLISLPFSRRKSFLKLLRKTVLRFEVAGFESAIEFRSQQ